MALGLHQSALARLQRLYEDCRPKLVAAARALPGVDEHTAEDAVQEAWLRLTRPEVLDRLDCRDPDRLRHMMLLTVCNAARNLRRAAAITDKPGDEALCALADPTPAPPEQAERKALQTLLRAAIDGLGEPDRSILLLQYYEGCGSRQTAALLKMSEANVRQRASRARQKLKQILQNEGLAYD